MTGQDMQSTTMIKGLRERSETSMGGEQEASISAALEGEARAVAAAVPRM